MTVQQVIGKAVTQGWGDSSASSSNGDRPVHEAVLLDPQFWQALARALGWNTIYMYGTHQELMPAWKYRWHRFIEHLAQGNSAESFFETIV